MIYRVILTPDDNDTLLVTCPALPGVVTFGETEGECREHALDAIEERIAGLISDGLDVPADEGKIEASAPVLPVVIPALIALKVELYRALRSAGLTRAELARRLDWNRNSVDRLFDINHGSRLEQIEAASHALGLEVETRIVKSEEFA